MALLLVNACNVGPKFVKPEVKLNPGWSSQQDARLAPTPIDAAWWRTFHDATLEHLVELAYQQNLPLQIAGLRILEARAQLGIAHGQQWPMNQNPIASATLIGLNSHPNGTDLDLLAGRYQVGFDAMWEVDFWGKYRQGARAAKANYFATVADYQDALVSLSAEVARTYAIIRTFEVLIALANDNVAVQEEGERIAESRFRNGATSELDVSQATNLLESTRATIPELRVGQVQAENALCTLLGRTTGCARPLLGAPGAIPTAPSQVAVSVPAEMLRRRPDIRGAEMRAIAQCDRIGMAKADLYPKLVLFGSVGTQTVNSTGASSSLSGLLNLFSVGSLLYSIGANLIFPILNYPQILNNVRVQDARLQEALVDYQNTALRAAQEVEDGMTGYLREQEAAVFAQNAATAAQNAVRVALVQYREGAVDYTRVLDSQRALLSSQNAVARARSTVATNLIALYKALGGGWELRDGQPFVTDANRTEMQKRTNWGGFFAKPLAPPPPSAPPPSQR